MKNSVSVIILVAVVNLFFSCKKEQLYFQKVERVESNTTSKLNRIHFVNDTTCIIAGGEKFSIAEVLRSTDGGYTWQSTTNFPETNKGQYGFGISPAGKIWLTGFDGTVLSSNDNGASWSEKRLGNWKYHLAVSFVNENRVVLVNTGAQKEGEIVIADTNQQILKTTTYLFGINDVQMVNAQTGYVAAYGVILKTTDGAENWEYLDIKNDNFTALDCKSADEVWACGYNGSIIHTTDGGKSWDRLRNGNSVTIAKYHLTDIVFKDADNGYAVGEDGLVIYTSNAGKDWTKYSRFTENTLRGITICPDGTLLVVGDKGVIYRLHP
jgi:photosystem II stability/assembly factor-like uncharacterized protein